ncbi:Putative DNA-binding protein in cluster with Type I restriction-modification system [Alloactinosynnema sp. L-07]|uniref:helix-turn-helix domain-containing protein n=1 Tax=Alloactinosynnema sp. L-07 TaxID=1653480 RepID=UPI00065F017C|nr:helix-turn-helix transcriptional regulator [Alloactinosynnema sp. L-07]CRK55353.1 Putative DNA-binding protein in cluster with Type I restriction-modification system [Alloactinosynnema sp. L-07]
MTKYGNARNRGLAAELKNLRKDAGLTLRQVERKVGISIASLSRMESGLRPITAVTASALLATYEVIGPVRARILVLAKEVNLSGWHETDGEGLPLHLGALTGFEAEATLIVHAAMLRIPGLLQTADYIRTTLTALGFPAQKRAEVVAARLERQKVLLGPNPPRYLTFIDEAVLRRPTGSRALMAAQCQHMADMAELPHVEIRVIPFECGTHAGLDGSYTWMEFAKNPPIVYLELTQSSMFRDAEHEIRPYRETTDKLMAAALCSAESVKFLRRFVSTFGKE